MRLFSERCTSGASLVACVLAACFAGGCGGGGGGVTVVDKGNFNDTVLAARQPVLVDFYKTGCPTCIPLDSTFEDLTKEYQGRAVIAKFEILNPVFLSPAPEIKQKYDIALVPTVILFVNGEAKKRWVSVYGAESYRRALDDALATQTATQPTK